MVDNIYIDGKRTSLRCLVRILCLVAGWGDLVWGCVGLAYRSVGRAELFVRRRNMVPTGGAYARARGRMP